MMMAGRHFVFVCPAAVMGPAGTVLSASTTLADLGDSYRALGSTYRDSSCVANSCWELVDGVLVPSMSLSNYY